MSAAIRASNNTSVDFLDNAKQKFKTGFKWAKKVVSVTEGSTKVAKQFTKLPGEVSEATKALKAFKIVDGALAVEDIATNAVKVATENKPKRKFFAGWKIIQGLAKILRAVEAVFFYLKELKVISLAQHAWTNVVGYVLLPISVISTFAGLF